MSFLDCRACLAAAAFAAVFSVAPAVAETSLRGAMEQGGVVIGTTEAGSRVTLDGKEIPVSDNGIFLLGFGRDAKSMKLVITAPDGSKENRALAIEKRKWDIQRINGLPPKQVTPDAATLERIKKENALIGSTRRKQTKTPGGEGFESGFVQPVDGRISGVFGSQRILNGQPRSPHSGLDIAAPTGTVMVATADGTVRMTQPDLYYTGQTVMIDHGHGLFSLYAHMSSIDVTDGQTVRRGQPIGKVGATGRVTGPHLHWGISWNGANVDPQTVLRVLLPVER